MALVVSSSYTLDVVQTDGRRRVYQTFVMDDGTTTTTDYLADVDADYDANLAAMVTSMNEVPSG